MEHPRFAGITEQKSTSLILSSPAMVKNQISGPDTEDRETFLKVNLS